jgi:type I restriction enzyme S subunit
MQADRTDFPLEDCMDAIIDYRGKTPTKTSSGIPLVTAKIVKDGRLEKPSEYISEEDYPRWMTRGLPKIGDVVLTTEAPLGEVAQLTDEKVALAQRIILLRGKPEILDNTYLKFLLRSEELQHRLSARASGSTVAGIKQSELRRIILPLPRISEQRAIASVLGALDDKIDINHKLSATFEAIVKALFKSWFVDFEPVRAKDEKRVSNMAPDIAAMFPTHLIESDLGSIPDGWTTLPLSKVLEESNERIGERIAPEYSSTNDGLRLRSDRFSKTLAVSSEKNKLIKKGFLVFGLSRSVLNFGLMRDDIGSVSAAYKVYKVNDRIISPDLLERLMRLNPEHFYKAVSASSREGQSVSTDGLGVLKFVRPPQDVQDAFYPADRLLTSRIQALELETQTLASIRDTLLPNLLSGKVCVSELDLILEKTA